MRHVALVQSTYLVDALQRHSAASFFLGMVRACGGNQIGVFGRQLRQKEVMLDVVTDAGG
jgi:hypothetical protein